MKIKFRDLKGIVVTLNLLIIIFLTPNVIYAQNFWIQTNGPYGGFISSITVNNFNGDIISVPNNSTIYQSDNNGETWDKINYPEGVTFGGGKIISNDEGDLFYYSDFIGLWRLKTGENIWTRINNGLNIPLNYIVLNGPEIIVFGNSDIYYSSDNGDSWEKRNTEPISIFVNCCIFNNKEIIIGSDGIYTSSDTGRTFIKSSYNFPSGVSVIDLEKSINGIIYASTSDGYDYIVYKLENDGFTWTQISEGLDLINPIFLSIHSLSICPNGNIFLGTSNGIYKLPNDSTSWEQIQNEQINDFYSLTVNASSDLFAATHIGVFRLLNSESSLVPVNFGIRNCYVNCIGLLSTNEIITGSNAGVFLTSDGGDNWEQLNNGIINPNITSVLIGQNKDIFIGTSFGYATPNAGIYYSIENNREWKNILNLGQHSVKAIVMDSKRNLYIGGDFGIESSTNYGVSWNIKNTGISNINISSLTIKNDDTLFAGTQGGGIYISMDNGENWVSKNSGLKSININCLCINNGLVYAGTDSGLFVSNNNGVNWMQIDKFRTSSLISEKNEVLRYGFGGLSYSTNNGSTWIGIDNSIPISCLNIDKEGYIWAGSSGNGVYKSLNTILPHPEIYIKTDSTINFINVQVDSNHTKSFIIENTGTDKLEIQGSKNMDPTFKINIPQFTLEPDSSKEIVVNFITQDTNEHFDTLEIFHNAEGSPSKIPLYGKGTTQIYAIQLTPDSILDFGSVLKDTSTSRTIKIENNGNAELKIDNIKNQYSSFKVDTTKFNLKPNTNKNITVTFTPTETLIYQDTLKIYSNAPSSPDTIYLTGKGVLSPSSAQISLSSTSIQFGDVKVNSSKPKILKIFNFGSANLIVNRISFDGSEFRTQKQFPDTINQKDSSEVIITFKPTSAVNFSRNLSIHNSTQDSLKVVSLIGNGFDYSSTISLNKTFSFGDVKNNNNYRIISLPGKSNNIKVQFSGEHKYDWKVFSDNGNDANYLQDSSDFVFSPGKAFWALSSQSMPINNQSDSSVQINTNDNSYSIPLHNGWNLISTPYDRSTDWSEVRTLNALQWNARLWEWNGSWDSSTVMKTYSGYYFYNKTNLDSLKIPYNPNGSGNKTVLKKDSSSSSNNYLKVTVSRESKESENIYAALIKIDPSSKEGVDEIDEYSPPSDFQNIGINLLRDNSGKRSDYLFADSRPAIGEGQEYNLQIKSIPNEAIILNTEGIENFSKYNLYLLDTRLINVYNLKQRKSITLALGHVYNYFKLYIGTDDYVKSIRELAVPSEYKLYQNYPNPFNPSTLIRFSVPEASEVTINIFNILGQKVRTLLNNRQYETGNYEIEFNGKEFASGVYIVSMETTKFRMQKKMILIK